MPYDDIAFDHDDDDEPSDVDPKNDLPAGFVAFHSRFPSIVSDHFCLPEPAVAEEEAPPNDDSAARRQRIDEHLDQLMRRR